MSTALQRGVFRALNRYVIAPRILSRPDKPVAQRRAAFEAMVKPPEPPPGITLETREMAGLQVDVLTPDGARGAVLYFHGGGYHIGSPRTHRRLAIDLARRSGATVYLPRYRLAPEHRFPAAVDDAAAAYGGLLAMGCQASAIVFGGDSAGGNLALCALLAATKAGRPPAGAILLSPWTDLANTGDSVRALASRDPVLTNKTLDASAKLYLGDHDPFDPACSPLYADLAGRRPFWFRSARMKSCLMTRNASRSGRPPPEWRSNSPSGHTCGTSFRCSAGSCLTPMRPSPSYQTS